MDRVRWGLLSTANINKRLIPAIRASQRGQLAAVASRDLQKVKAYADRWEIPQAFGSYEAMLESDAVDAVYLSLPNHLHAGLSIRALQAGKHVLCEKPLALTVAEVDAMADASRQSGRVLAEAFMYRHHPQMKTAGEWVRSGRLGEIQIVRGIFNFKIRDRARDVRLVPEFGGGSLWDVGCYPVSFAQYVYGATPEKVYGLQWVGDTGVDEAFTGLLHYAGDRMAEIASSVRMAMYTSAEVIGTEGRLAMQHPFNWSGLTPKLVFFPNDEEEPLEVPFQDELLYLGEVEDLNAAILDGSPQYLTLEESRNHIRTLTALYASAQTGQVIEV
jgi:predicted dehydrogenase